MLDLYSINGSVTLRHGTQDVPGVAKPLWGPDILLYDVFLEFVRFLEISEQNHKCETITIILESYVFNKKIYTTINQSGLADKYLYVDNPNFAKLEDVCNRLIIFTSHTKDVVKGIHPPSLYKENHYKYYKGGDVFSKLSFEACESRGEGRAQYGDATVKIFCFNHFSPISPLLELAILAKPLLHSMKESIDSSLERLRIPYKFATLPQDATKAANSLYLLTAHLDECRKQGIKDNFFPTIIAVDFIEKDSGVFLCCGDPACLLGEESSAIKELEL